jgi:hypothetical protein
MGNVRPQSAHNGRVLTETASQVCEITELAFELTRGSIVMLFELIMHDLATRFLACSARSHCGDKPEPIPEFVDIGGVTQNLFQHNHTLGRPGHRCRACLGFLFQILALYLLVVVIADLRTKVM